jgi:hypothetical protein
MQQITLNIEEKYMDTFLAYIKTLNYVKIHKNASKAVVETHAKGFQRIAEDAEMLDLANQGMGDYLIR